MLAIVMLFSDHSEARQLDTIPSLDRQLADLLYDPFVDETEAIMQYFNVLTAYELWTESQRIRDTTPLVDRIDILTEKARAEMLMGTFLAIILEEYVAMESGVLPITEKAIARLDSASSRLREVIRYGVEGTESLYTLDSDFAAYISDSLKSVRDAFQFEPVYTIAAVYDPRRIIINCFETARKDYPTHVYRRSLAYWFYESITAEPETDD